MYLKFLVRMSEYEFINCKLSIQYIMCLGMNEKKQCMSKYHDNVLF